MLSCWSEKGVLGKQVLLALKDTTLVSLYPPCDEPGCMKFAFFYIPLCTDNIAKIDLEMEENFNFDTVWDTLFDMLTRRDEPRA
jgi:hypothetical protein